MTEDAAAPTRRRRWRRRWLVVLVLTLVVLLARAGLDLWAGHRVDQEVARLEKRWGSLAEATLRLPPVPAADNRARVVRAAAALTILENRSPNMARSAVTWRHGPRPRCRPRFGPSSKSIAPPSAWRKRAAAVASRTGKPTTRPNAACRRSWS